MSSVRQVSLRQLAIGVGLALGLMLVVPIDCQIGFRALGIGLVVGLAWAEGSHFAGVLGAAVLVGGVQTFLRPLFRAPIGPGPAILTSFLLVMVVGFVVVFVSQVVRRRIDQLSED